MKPIQVHARQFLAISDRLWRGPSVVLHVLFYITITMWTGLLSCSLLLWWAPKHVWVVVSRLWTTGILKAAQFFLGIRTCVRGKQHLSDVPLPYIIACQHQSAWETLFFNTLVPNPVFFLKRSLLFLPIVGIYLRGLGMIPISRAQKKEMKKSRHEMDQAIQKAIAQKRPFILFPEGTRMRPGEQKPYHSGVYHIAKDYGLPVIPAALNSGIYWPRRGFLKKPGTICLTFGPPLDASLPKAEFIAQLRDRIEQQGGDPMPDEKCA